MIGEKFLQKSKNLEMKETIMKISNKNIKKTGNHRLCIHL